MPIPWKEEYSVHVKEIDDQHSRFVAILNELYDAINTHRVHEVLGHILDEVISYGGYHFATEEKYFDMFQYPDAAAHKEKHEEFRAKMADLKRQFEEGKGNVTFDLVDSMENWLVQHILDYDQKYSAFFNEHGLH